MSCDNVGLTPGSYNNNNSTTAKREKTDIIVQGGETPESIGKLFGIKAKDVIAQNKNKWNGKWFKVGDKLTISSNTSPDKEQLAGRAQSRKEAESLWLSQLNKRNDTASVDSTREKSVTVPKPAESEKPYTNELGEHGVQMGKKLADAISDAAKSNKGKGTAAQNGTQKPKADKQAALPKQANQRAFKGSSEILKDPKMQEKIDKVKKMNLFSTDNSTEGSSLSGITRKPTDTFKNFSKAKANLNLGVDAKKTKRNAKAAGDITYHKDGSVTLSDRVEKRIQQMSQNLKCDSTDLKGLLFAESGFEINGRGSAAGINQLTQTGVKGYNSKYGTNISKAKVRNMDVMQQLDVAEKSLKLGKELGGFSDNEQISGGQLFALNMYPAKAKKYRVISKFDAPTAYYSNRRLDFNGDGHITIDEYNREILNKARFVRSEKA